jgi:hypothetical protein
MTAITRLVVIDPGAPRRAFGNSHVAIPQTRLRGKYTRTMPEPDYSLGTTACAAENTRYLGHFVRKLSVWLLEVAGEAFGTCLILIASGIVQSWHEKPPLNNDVSLHIFFGITFAIVFMFAVTGYLATTLISRFALRGELRRFYPYVCAGLYLVHSTIFFVGGGNAISRPNDLIIQIGGAFLTLACAFGGNWLIFHCARPGYSKQSRNCK